MQRDDQKVMNFALAARQRTGNCHRFTALWPATTRTRPNLINEGVMGLENKERVDIDPNTMDAGYTHSSWG
jgi:hypothetical protein